MNRQLYIVCEGMTERQFISEVLSPYLANTCNVYASPAIVVTSHSRGQVHKGGVSNYAKLKSTIVSICKEHRNEMVTTMFDYYGMPHDTPCIEETKNGLYETIEHVENAITSDIAMDNFLGFNFSVHEIEAFLFSQPEVFSLLPVDDEAIDALTSIRRSASNPEYINTAYETAPSRRIQSVIPGFRKTSDGVALLGVVGIPGIMAECPHFASWIRRIETAFRP